MNNIRKRALSGLFFLENLILERLKLTTMFSSYYLSGEPMKYLRHISLFRNNIENIPNLKGYISLEVICLYYIYFLNNPIIKVFVFRI